MILRAIPLVLLPISAAAEVADISGCLGHGRSLDARSACIQTAVQRCYIHASLANVRACLDGVVADMEQQMDNRREALIGAYAEAGQARGEDLVLPVADAIREGREARDAACMLDSIRRNGAGGGAATEYHLCRVDATIPDLHETLRLTRGRY